MFEDLAAHDNFFLAALGATREDGSHADIYVHAKVAVIDDQWATIGSANAMFRSFRDDTELNVTVWDRAVAGALRADLLAEHLGTTGSLADDRAALASLRERALDNRERLLRGQPLDGQVHAIEARDWALPRDGSAAPVAG
jgi:phosphatidylserine/phosphatidylglycerophosphate/cardiolipin synthase-like enzyme